MGLRDIICQNCGRTLSSIIDLESGKDILNIKTDMLSYFQTTELDKDFCLYTFTCPDCGCMTQIKY